MKPNNKILYVYRQSNHSPALLNNIPENINKRLTSISSSQKVFDDAIPPYQKALDKSGYKHKLTYNPQPKRKKSRQRKKFYGTTPHGTPASKLTWVGSSLTSSTDAFQTDTHYTRSLTRSLKKLKTALFFKLFCAHKNIT